MYKYLNIYIYIYIYIYKSSNIYMTHQGQTYWSQY